MVDEKEPEDKKEPEDEKEPEDKKEPEKDKKIPITKPTKAMDRIRNFNSRLPKVKTKKGFKSFLSNMPTPGSIGFPLFFVVLFFFILIKVNGETRLNWLYDVIVGNAGIPISVGSTGPDSTSSNNTSIISFIDDSGANSNASI